MTTIIQLLLVLGLMVLVHEFGHFVIAKWCGVRVETFAIGFGKRLFGFVHGGTDYCVNALPLGGYVKMAGEIPGETISNDPGELNNHPRWQRMLIAVAGPVANFILALAMMAGAYMLHHEVDQYMSGTAVTDYITAGSPAANAGIQAGDTIVSFDGVQDPTWADVFQHAALHLNRNVPFAYTQDGKTVDSSLFIDSKAKTPDDFSPDSLGLVPKMQPTPVKVFALVPGSPADHAGLKPGDQIVRIDSLTIHSVPSLLAYMQDRKGKPAVLTVLRDGKTFTVDITPQLSDADGLEAYRLGFQPVAPPVKIEKLSFPSAVAASWTFCVKSTALIEDVLKGMIERHISIKTLAGPIGIGEIVHQAAAMPGWMPLIETMASISINLGIFNLLPIPILDGGMIFFLIIESVIGRDFPMQVKERVYQVAFVCLILFAAMVIFNDITKLPFFAHLKS